MTTPLANPDEMLTVEAVEVVGSTILSPRQIRQLIEPVLFRRVTRRQLQDVADAITRIYVEQGYITSRAVVVEETIPLGKIRIDVIEGRLADIQITGNRRLSTAYIRSRLKLADKVPLNVNALEEQLRLLRATPYIENIEATLRPSEDPQARAGDSILLVKVLEDKQPLVLGVGFDNYIPPSISQQRGLFYLGYQNISGIGDEIFGSYTFGLTPSRFGVPALNELDLRYRVPINPMDGTIQVRLVATASQITDRAFEALDINAISGLAEFSFRQPIIRSVRQELALSTGFTYQISQTFTFAGPTPFGFGPDRDGSSRTSVLKFGVDYTYRDTSGVWLALSQFNLGLPIFNATLNGDGPFPGKVFPDGRFLSWQAQGLRLQNLGNDFLLILRGDVQLATRPLLAQHQFVIGGGQSVRGYRQNARSGDNGMRISAEFRIPAARDANGQPFFYLTPFIEFGRVWNNRTNPNVLTTPNTLAGAGIGFLWTPVPGLDVRFDAGVPIIYNRDRGFDMQDYGLYFSVVYRAF
ncbi:MAG: ShlB/FhaC/HecB family hemolysin secretion/activation protein [Gloeomargarita sp. SKYBB_i_bin120]|nr:BamA/TamA family outer membrane protein [Gloeomargarita sp. SKYG98]MCS7292862.1 BamA/TamA family outer membrane protein [Gloeomargarita sp. SKYB120]MDW8178425.1 ShlB/FhaC/HecB family hemolysin secretion/activation protein [Gloeomargarita sp. SKYBB_i_bin120]